MQDEGVIRLGTRRSPLAQAQADRVLGLLPQGAARKVLVESEGDLDATSPLHAMPRPGAFTSVLTDAILDGRLDAAVHSLKDLPLQAPPQAPIVAVLPRDDAADVLIHRVEARDASRPLGLAPGSRVGTSAPRRQSQLLEADPELIPVDVRGNVGTRLKLVEHGVLEGLLMAAAAFERLDLPLPPGVARTRLDPARFPTGPGQGAIAVQARAGSRAAALLERLDHAPTRAAVEAERALLGKLGGGCGMPLGVHVRATERGWEAHATLAPEGWEPRVRPLLARADASAPDLREAVERAFAALRQAPSPAPRKPAHRVVALTLSASACEAYADLLAEAGWRVEAWELIEEIPTGAPMPDASRVAWVAVSSPRAVAYARSLLAARPGPPPRLAAIGPATARALRAEGLPVHVVAKDGTGRGLAEAIAAFPAAPAPVAIPQARRALPDLAEGLRARGFPVEAWPAYDVAPRAPPMPKEAEAVVLASPSNVEAYAKLGLARHPRLVAFGPSTEAAMRQAGLPVAAVAPTRSPHGLLQVLS